MSNTTKEIDEMITSLMTPQKTIKVSSNKTNTVARRNTNSLYHKKVKENKQAITKLLTNIEKDLLSLILNIPNKEFFKIIEDPFASQKYKITLSVKKL